MNGRENITPVFAWRLAFMSKHGPHATTRAVLGALALHMRGDGAGAFPSTKLLAEESGLSERTVCTHLEKAKEAGWIVVIQRAGKVWVRHEYRAIIPAEVAEAMDFTAQREALYTRPDFSRPVRQQVQSSTERGSVEGGTPFTHSLRTREEDSTPAERVVLQEGLPARLLHTHAKEALKQLVDEGATLEDIRAATQQTRENYPSWGVSLVARKVRDAVATRGRAQNQAAPDRAGAWWESWQQVVAKGAEKGMHPLPEDVPGHKLIFTNQVKAVYGITA